MVAWQEVKKPYSELSAMADRSEDVYEAANRFKAVSNQVWQSPPAHLRLLFRELKQLGDGMPRDSVRILDHGSGGGLTCLILLCNGYSQTYGVDVGTLENMERLNARILPALGLSGEHFFVYDGKVIPFESNNFEVVFSQQVVEHVSANYFEAYWSEEARVLKPTGVALHQIPHALTPYDTHSRTWLVHMIPKPLRRLAYKLAGQDPDYIEGILHLRWPWTIRKAAAKHFNSVRDITARRLQLSQDEASSSDAEYEGPRRARNVALALQRAPFVNGVVRKTLASLAMMELKLSQPQS